MLIILREIEPVLIIVKTGRKIVKILEMFWKINKMCIK